MADINATMRGGRGTSRFACFLAVVPMVLITCLVSLTPVDAAGSEPTPSESINGTVTELFSILKKFQGPDRSHRAAVQSKE